MTITSTGYDGEVNETAWSTFFPSIGLAHYGVVGATDWKVTAVSGVDRTVSISAGSGWGKGVYDVSGTAVQLQLGTIGSGTRWDMIVQGRNWSGTGGTTAFRVVAGGASKALPSRNTSPGDLDDQPVALVQVTAGQTQPTAIVDLRCWAGPGGFEAVDLLVKNYMNLPGVALKIGTDLWRWSPDGSNVWGWISFVPPVATLSKDGLMSKADRGTLNGVASTTYVDALGTSVDTPSTIMRRDGSGRSRVDDPSDVKDIVNKEYADALGTSVDTPSTIMRRDSAGRSRVDDPSNGKDIANKEYVDGLTPTKMQFGAGSITLASNAAFRSISVFFPVAFTAVPMVFVSSVSNVGYPATRLNLTAINRAANGFDIKLATIDGNNIGTSFTIAFEYFAVQP